MCQCGGFVYASCEYGLPLAYHDQVHLSSHVSRAADLTVNHPNALMEYWESNRPDLIASSDDAAQYDAIVNDHVVSYRPTGNRYENRYIGKLIDGRIMLFHGEPTRENYPRLS